MGKRCLLHFLPEVVESRDGRMEGWRNGGGGREDIELNMLGEDEVE